LASNWARTATEDKDENLWLGWSGGLTRMSPDGRQFRLWQNVKDKPSQIQFNSVRSLFCDDKGDIWICTTNGMNRYRAHSGKMEFLDEKDSLPHSFYWVVKQDSRGTIWIGDRINLYYYDPTEKKFHTSANHPVLARIKNRGVRCMIEDSRKRLWFGMNGSGLVMYDPANNGLKEWVRSDANDSMLIGNTITSLVEDKKGIIWASSFIGLVSYDPQKDRFKQYNRQNGLNSIKTSCLAVDRKNRLWIGTTSGLLMLDAGREHFSNFDLHDGLPTLEFSDQAIYTLKDGRFIFPTMKGFVLFDANNYQENINIPDLYLSSIKVHNKEFPTANNYEDVKSIELAYHENFFSIEMAALNYNNPIQTWYAYKLEPFDKDWIYSKDRLANYTNVPGGDYTFHYKATANPNNWSVPEKLLAVSIGTVFYNTIWFWILVGLLVCSLLYAFYRFRIHQFRKIYSLQNKAQALEKEKTLVMYESLKQQLNPHFLFNSLTSLSSLIRVNPMLAGEFLNGLSKTYRYILKNRDNELAPLGDEIRFARTYVKLQQIRFEKGLDVVIGVDESDEHFRIAPATIQQMIENAIKHNIIDEESPLLIEIYTEMNWLVVRNNLQKKNFVETSNKQGLNYLKSLYYYLSDRPLEIHEDEAFFTVKIPLI
jgi:sugar lactone lactonase YvrE